MQVTRNLYAEGHGEINPYEYAHEAVPTDGPVCTKHELDLQKAFLLEWIAAVQSAIGQEHMLDHVIEHNAAALYDKLKEKWSGLFQTFSESLFFFA